MANPGLADGLPYPLWPGNTLGFSRKCPEGCCWEEEGCPHFSSGTISSPTRQWISGRCRRWRWRDERMCFCTLTGRLDLNHFRIRLKNVLICKTQEIKEGGVYSFATPSTKIPVYISISNIHVLIGCTVVLKVLNT